VSLLDRLFAWMAPSVRPPDADATEAARIAGIQAETARQLRGGLHARKADRQLREAREELGRAKVRVAALRLAEVRAQRDGARERAWDG
jgi:hypothetical protein